MNGSPILAAATLDANGQHSFFVPNTWAIEPIFGAHVIGPGGISTCGTGTPACAVSVDEPTYADDDAVLHLISNQPSKPVGLVYDGPAGHVSLGTVSTDADGSLDATGGIPGPAGQGQITATVGGANCTDTFTLS